MAVNRLGRCFQIENLFYNIRDYRQLAVIWKMDFQAHTWVGFRKGCREKTGNAVYGDAAAVYVVTHNLHTGDCSGFQKTGNLPEVEWQMKG